MAQDHPTLKVLPFARLLAVVFSLLGLTAGLIYSLGGLAYDLITTGSLNSGTALAFLSLIGMPTLFGLAGLLAGLIGGWLFNSFFRSLAPLLPDLDLREP